jgi:cysteine desulfurase family protein (TIGR01976 family)
VHVPEFDARAWRNRFPALQRKVGSRAAIYLDGPGGTQVPDTVIEAMAGLLRRGAGNTGGTFSASLEAGEVVDAARAAVADFFNAPSPSEIVFGQNMTSLTFAAARAIAETWKPGDEIVLTTLDHDANVWPWVREAERRGVTVRYAQFDPSAGCVLPLDAVTTHLGPRTRLVAVTRASNALGTLVDVTAVAQAAHAVGALCFVDAVHYAPHGPIDVAAYGCDFLAASAYKFFGPHTGMLFGRREHLSGLDVARLRAAPQEPPERWETGTQSFESLAGVAAAIDYLAELGEGDTRRAALGTAMRRVAAYEAGLGERFLRGIEGIEGVELYGPTRPELRTPTFSVAVAGLTPREATARLAERGIFAWSGHNYAIGVMERLGRLERGGLLRIGFVHYNVAEEVDAAVGALEDLAAGR